jgi:hypothetical protein
VWISSVRPSAASAAERRQVAGLGFAHLLVLAAHDMVEPGNPLARHGHAVFDVAVPEAHDAKPPGVRLVQGLDHAGGEQAAGRNLEARRRRGRLRRLVAQGLEQPGDAVHVLGGA